METRAVWLPTYFKIYDFVFNRRKKTFLMKVMKSVLSLSTFKKTSIKLTIYIYIYIYTSFLQR